ncbi:hypothetical protein CAOG_02654, partial [Capsaspora owczarzaki ATCC 30864]|uniref:hypothetical protein n=1 Tax=Capsaspora owczarzaki (strain ATCC 30864) TaxID=595528 RepID=UPI0003521426
MSCAVRALWIISLPTGKLLVARRYPTVERRAKLLAASSPSESAASATSPSTNATTTTTTSSTTTTAAGTTGAYTPLMDDARLVPQIAAALAAQGGGAAAATSKQPCDSSDLWPVFSVSNGDIWPLVAVRQNDMAFVCLPLIETPGLVRTPLVELPSITVGVTLMHDLATAAGPGLLTDTTGMAANEVYNFLCVAMPFGAPLDTSPSNVRNLLTTKFPPKASAEKQPAWKPVLFKGKQRIVFNVSETVRAVQYDNPEVLDEWEAFGTIQCKAEIEGLPEVTVSLSSTAGIDQISVDPCVLSNNDAQVSGGSTAQASVLSNRKLSFAPPLETFSLCHYRASGIKELPIRGFYQMKEAGENMIKLLVQLKLHQRVNNQFDYCELRVPFFNRGIIRNFEAAPTGGTVTLSASQRMLVWNIGQKFTGRNLEVSLTAVVQFGNAPGFDPSEGMNDSEYPHDPFCVGPNAFVDLFFKIPEFNLSGCTVDPKSIVLYPSNKIKAVITRELTASSYRIWNSLGEARVTIQPPPLT